MTEPAPIPTLTTASDQQALQIALRLHDLVDSEFTAFADFYEVQGQLHFGRISSVGGDAAVQVWSDLQHREAHTPWSPYTAPPATRNAFTPCFPPDDEEEFVWSHMYNPVGLLHTRRILVYDDQRFVGWIGTHRLADNRDFSANELHQLKCAANDLAAVTIARARASDGPPPGGANILLRANGTVSAACAEGDRWLTRARRQLLADKVRAVQTGRHPPGPFLVDNAEVRVVRMDGEGSPQLLCMLSPARRPRLSPLADLTAVQREVARCAAAGATVPEIARHLGRSRETVRSHLKAIYDRLEVASRVELVQRLNGG